MIKYKYDKEPFSYTKVANEMAKSKEKFTFLKEVDSVALQQSLRNLDTAFKNFFKKKCRFPRFKSRHSRQSYTTIMNGNSIKLEQGKIKLPKMGRIKTATHRMPPKNWEIKSATVSMEKDYTFYIAVLFGYERNIISIKEIKTSIGLDYKSNGLYADSNGEFADYNKYYRKSEKKLRHFNKELSRRKLNSANWVKTKLKIAKLNRYIVNQRKDFQQKLSTILTDKYDLISVEDLNIKEMMKNLPFKNFHKATLDNSFSYFRTMLEYKMADKGKYFIKVDKNFESTQICFNCKRKNPTKIELHIRKWNCPFCGSVHDRDVNAAKNILEEGLRLSSLK